MTMLLTKNCSKRVAASSTQLTFKKESLVQLRTGSFKEQQHLPVAATGSGALVTSLGLWREGDATPLVGVGERGADKLGDSITHAAATNDGLIVTCSSNGKVLAWQNWKQQKKNDENYVVAHRNDIEPVVLAEDLGDMSAVALSRDGSCLAVSLAGTGEIWLLEMSPKKGSKEIARVDLAATLENAGSIIDMYFVHNDDDSLFLLCLTLDGSVKLYGRSILNREWASECIHEAPRLCFSGHQGVSCAAYSPPSRLVAAGNSSGDVQFLEVVSNKVQKVSCVNVRADFTRALDACREQEEKQKGVQKKRQNRNTESELEVQRAGTKTSRSYFSLVDGVEVSCEILQIAFLNRTSYERRCEEEEEEDENMLDVILKAPERVLVATNLGLLVLSARTKEALGPPMLYTDLLGGTLYGSLIASIRLAPVEGGGANCVAKIMISDSERHHVLRKGGPFAFAVAVEDHKQRTNEDEEESEVPETGQLDVIAKTAVQPESFLALDNRKVPPMTQLDIFKKETTSLGKRLLGGFSRPPMARRVRSSGYGGGGGEQSKMFQPKTNKGKKKQQKERRMSQPAILSDFDAKSLSSTSSANGGRARWDKTGSGDLKKSSSILLLHQTVVVSEDPPTKATKTLRVWNTEGAITRVAFSARGKTVAAAALGKSADNSVQVFGTSEKRLNLEEATSLLGHKGQVRGLDFAHCSDGLLLSVGAEDRTVRLWDWRSRTVRLEVNAKSGRGASASSKGSDLATSFLPSSNKNTQGNHQDKKPDSFFFPDQIARSQFFYMDQFLVSAAANKLFVHQLHGLHSEDDGDAWYALAKSFKLSACKTITDFAAANQFFSYLGVCACSDRALRIIDFNEMRVSREVPDVHSRPVQRVVLPRHGNVSQPEMANLMVTTALGNGAKLWDIRASCGSPVQRYDWPGSGGGRICSGLDLSPCMRFLGVGSEDGGVYCFDLRRAGSYVERLSSQDQTAAVTDVAFNPSGSQLIAATQSGELIVFEH